MGSWDSVQFMGNNLGTITLNSSYQMYKFEQSTKIENGKRLKT